MDPGPTDFLVKKVISGIPDPVLHNYSWSVLGKKSRIRNNDVKEADLVWFLPGVSPGVRHQIAGMAEGFLTHITAEARSAKNRR